MLTITAHPRSGSFYLMHRLRRFHPLHAYSEIFHFHDDVISRALGDHAKEVFESLGLSLPVVGQDVLRNLVTTRVEDYLGAISSANPDTIPAFKIFPYHLDVSGLEIVIRRSSGILLLTRNLIHAHISREIALSTNTYKQVDTSHMKIEFRVTDFMEFVRISVEHYDCAIKLAEQRKTPIGLIAYEDMMAANSNDDFLSEAISPLLAGTTLTSRDYQLEPVKQDKRSSALDKVTNPQAMTEFLKNRNLEQLLDATQSIGLGEWRKVIRDYCKL